MCKRAIPDEGAIFWITAATIPTDVHNESGAHEFISAILDPQISKKIAEQSGFSTPNSASQNLLSEEIRNDPNSYPGQDILARCSRIRDIGPLDTHLTTYWKKLKKVSQKQGCFWKS